MVVVVVVVVVMVMVVEGGGEKGVAVKCPVTYVGTTLALAVTVFP